MSSLKFLKGRIKSIKSTKKITRAMQLISAARLSKARESLDISIPYTNAMKKIVTNIASCSAVDLPIIKGFLGEQKHLIVVVTSDRGLCGSFNSSIIKKAKEHCLQIQSLQEKFYIICIGKRGYESLRNYFGSEVVTSLPTSKQVNIELADSIAEEIINDLKLGKFNQFNLIFSKFISVIKNETVNDKVIPCKPNSDSIDLTFEYEPALTEMIDVLMKKYVTAFIYSALLENAASEHGARMTAMDNATRNAKDMLHNLSHKYNRTRQALITKELIEIISGAQTI